MGYATGQSVTNIIKVLHCFSDRPCALEEYRIISSRVGMRSSACLQQLDELHSTYQSAYVYERGIEIQHQKCKSVCSDIQNQELTYFAPQKLCKF